MRRGAAISAAFALLLVASLTAKFAVAHGRSDDDEPRLASDLQHRLMAAGFAATAERRPKGIVVHGQRGNCRLLVRDGDLWPVIGMTFERSARGYGRLQYLYRGNADATPPRLRPALDRLGQHLSIAFGRPAIRPALLAIAATPACGPIDRIFDGTTIAPQAAPH